MLFFKVAQIPTFIIVIHFSNSYFAEGQSAYKQDTELEKKYEIYYRYVFTATFPHKPTSGKMEYDLAIPVTNISHIAHDQEAQEIEAIDQDSYIFTPRKKVGMDYLKGHAPGESFRDDFLVPSDQMTQKCSINDKYKYVSSEESLLPEGYYSWWGISVPDRYKKDLLLQPELIAFWEKHGCPDYLQYPPSSRYGNNEFIGSLDDLILCYKSSRQMGLGHRSPEVHLVVGGTLRYSNEISCVIVVCTEKETQSGGVFSDFLPVTHPQFELNESRQDSPTFVPNLIDVKTGKVNEHVFFPRFLSTKKSWASLSFAFYFDQPHGTLTCGRDVVRKRPVDHYTCVRMELTQKEKHYVCPFSILTQTDDTVC